ncbi:MAG TPA: TIGR04290 family methyltransferase, partial [Kofleriaceae bacterium]|nr:TIGR04290 family methyltransferase [Kofleriaceae bacterium]
MPEAKLHDEIRSLAPWFHNMVLDGIPTAPDHFLGDYPQQKFRRFANALPADLTGKTVLDIGCNAGFYAFEMKRRGAARVVAVDTDERYLAQARLASRVLGLEIELRSLDVYRVAELRERFDLVIFMGVLYHLRHPLLALDRLYDHVVGDRLLFQSMQRGPTTVAPVEPDYPFEETAIFDRPGHPAMYFVEQRYAGDWTNWWVPNRACVEAMLRSSGFEIEQRI